MESNEVFFIAQMDAKVENPPMKSMSWFNVGQNSLKNQRIRPHVLKGSRIVFQLVFRFSGVYIHAVHSNILIDQMIY